MVSIIKQGDVYLIRKATIIGYLYLETDASFWWKSESAVDKYCLFRSVEDAEKCWKKHKELIKDMRVIKIKRLK